ncbi:AfsA-related hotdog domain-containing protein [Kitasatospora camelliae]|uniref:AfsA-related hotdog domain-containing protein n=1 Tax=Kitasatospora camelliae TaxID=3156397 RepID=A0AAU8JXV3_9ACTN
MTDETMVVVGDRFEEFLENKGTVPAGVLLERLRNGDLPPRIQLTVGQGLTAAQLAELAALAERGPTIVAIRQGAVPAPAERRLTHKHDAKNVLIGTVEQTGAGTFRAPLVLDERVEVLEDHLTGQHIPAVTLLEAARQTWTVVTEQFLLTEDIPTRFVINSVDSAFHRFVFPLPATLEYRLVSHQRSPVGQTIAFTVEVHQQGEKAATFNAEIRVIPQLFAAKQEAMAARQAVRDELTALASPELAGVGG